MTTAAPRRSFKSKTNNSITADMKVDLSNPYLRDAVRTFGAERQAHMAAVRANLSNWLAQSELAEWQNMVQYGLKMRPLAATLDIDEVVLCNIHMNSFKADAGVQGPHSIDFHAADHFRAPNGEPWPRDDLRLNPLLPGARDLIDDLHARGVTVFLVTGRLESIRDETVENLEYVGLASTRGGASFSTADIARNRKDSLLIMCPDKDCPMPGQSIRPYKEECRRTIETTHRIALNVGDQVSDLGLYGDVQVYLPHPFYYTP
jgi:predicted secreted acid phosphatase